MFKAFFMFALVISGGGTHAEGGAVAPVDPHAITEELISEFQRIVSCQKSEPERWSALAPRIHAELTRRIDVESAHATSYPLQPWRMSVNDHVEELADQFTALLFEPVDDTAIGRRAERVVSILADLATVLGKNSGGRASFIHPCNALALGLSATAIGAMGLDQYWVSGALFGSASFSGLAGVATEKFAQRRGTYDKKMDVAVSGADSFWRRVADNLRQGSTDESLLHDPDEISAWAHQKLGVPDSALTDGCEAWLNRGNP